MASAFQIGSRGQFRLYGCSQLASPRIGDRVLDCDIGTDHIWTARSQRPKRTPRKSLERTDDRISSPVIGTISVSSRLPRNISFVIVSAKPFQEIKKPSVERWLRFSIFSLNNTKSFFPHFPVQFLHSARINAASRRSRASLQSFRTDISISSVAVRTRPVSWTPKKRQLVKVEPCP